MEGPKQWVSADYHLLWALIKAAQICLHSALRVTCSWHCRCLHQYTVHVAWLLSKQPGYILTLSVHVFSVLTCLQERTRGTAGQADGDSGAGAPTSACSGSQICSLCTLAVSLHDLCLCWPPSAGLVATDPCIVLGKRHRHYKLVGPSKLASWHQQNRANIFVTCTCASLCAGHSCKGCSLDITGPAISIASLKIHGRIVGSQRSSPKLSLGYHSEGWAMPKAAQHAAESRASMDTGCLCCKDQVSFEQHMLFSTASTRQPPLCAADAPAACSMLAGPPMPQVAHQLGP